MDEGKLWEGKGGSQRYGSIRGCRFYEEWEGREGGRGVEG